MHLLTAGSVPSGDTRFAAAVGGCTVRARIWLQTDANELESKNELTTTKRTELFTTAERTRDGPRQVGPW